MAGSHQVNQHVLPRENGIPFAREVGSWIQNTVASPAQCQRGDKCDHANFRRIQNAAYRKAFWRKRRAKDEVMRSAEGVQVRRSPLPAIHSATFQGKANSQESHALFGQYPRSPVAIAPFAVVDFKGNPPPSGVWCGGGGGAKPVTSGVASTSGRFCQYPWRAP